MGREPKINILLRGEDGKIKWHGAFTTQELEDEDISKMLEKTLRQIKNEHMPKKKKQLIKGDKYYQGERGRISMSTFNEFFETLINRGITKVGDKIEVTVKYSRKGKIQDIEYLEMERTK